MEEERSTIDSKTGRVEHLTAPTEFTERMCWGTQLVERKRGTVITCAVHPLPDPGSYEAAKLGCSCPVTVNGAGREEGARSIVGIGGGDEPLYLHHDKPEKPWVNPKCRVHGDVPGAKRKRRWWRFWRRS